MHRVWLSCVLLALMLSGCATTDVKLKLPPTGLPTTIPGGNQRQIVLTLPFADARQVPALCGVQKSGYGDETATVYCESDPARWIAQALAAELVKSGFTVLSADEGAPDTAVRIEGALLRLFAEPVVGPWSTTIETDLSVRLVATSRTGLRTERTFFVKGGRESIVWTAKCFNESLERGTQDLLAKMVEAILELMKQYPELGFTRPDPVRLAGWREASR